MSVAQTDIASTIPPSIAIDVSVIPIREIDDTLVLATSQIPSAETEARLRFILNRSVRFVFRSSDWIAAKLQEYYEHPHRTNTDVTADRSITWYWPGWHSWNGSMLAIKASGWSDGVHWTGAAEFPPDHADHEFWRWVIRIPQYNRLVDESEVPSIKRIWLRYNRRATKLPTNEPMYGIDEVGQIEMETQPPPPSDR